MAKDTQEKDTLKNFAKIEIGEAGDPNLIEMVWLLKEQYHETKLANLLGVDFSTLRNWMHLRSLPTTDNAKRIEKLFWETFTRPNKGSSS